MSTSTDVSTARPPVPLGVAALMAVPGTYLGAAAYLGLPAPQIASPILVLVYGLAIVGAAFLLSWAAEAVQVDINAGLALALLALVAVLPEYAVDFVFTTQCGGAYAGDGGTPDVCGLALANMTGANRVLVGVGWPLVVLVATLALWRGRKDGGRSDSGREDGRGHRPAEVRLAPAMSVEVVFLGLATLYSLTLPLRGSLTLVDSAVFLAIFAGYAWRLSRMEASEPDLLGTSAWMGGLDTRPRRAWVIGTFVVAGLVILACAEHFAESLTSTGEELGVSQFLLVQWIAPLASESPELIVACLYAWRMKADESLGALLSSKVNQWTLLVGGLPIVFGLTAGTTAGLPMDTDQRFELLITAAQSLFAVALLLDLRLTARDAGILVALFSTQFLVSVLGTDAANRYVIVALSVVYLGWAAVRIARRLGVTAQLVRDATVTPMSELPTEVA
ncbi:sodium:proton exchanger [Nocardioides sp. GY 10127]|uniref:sodium:proton exchanger n=1 Tax=Nocardioides sp. GY 10127 TaxID=2569762 RepID=UPI0010A85398|nr:sodium:proton exchanger [Nocardioides sp. GY 10127]TIC83323.1 sodium:proton exchanger [Nocardioides sp. GY 10127]